MHWYWWQFVLESSGLYLQIFHRSLRHWKIAINSGLSVTAPEGTSYDYMDSYMDSLTQMITDSIPEKTKMISLTAPGFGGGAVNSGFIRVSLTDPKDRKRTQQQIVDDVNKDIKKFPQGRAFAVQEQTISVSRHGGQPVQFVIQNNDFDKIRAVLPEFLDEANKSPILDGVDADLKFNKPELRVNIDRLRASELGVSVDNISQALELAYSDRRLGYFLKSGKQYEVLGQVDRNDRDDPNDLSKIMVKNSRSENIRLR